jgi:hypothetical protein
LSLVHTFLVRSHQLLVYFQALFTLLRTLWKILFSETYLHVVWYMFTNNSEEHTAFIFRVQV